MERSERMEKLAEKYVDIIKQEGRVGWQNLSGYYLKGILISMLRAYEPHLFANNQLHLTGKKDAGK